jgi:hypothetical protein
MLFHIRCLDRSPPLCSLNRSNYLTCVSLSQPSAVANGLWFQGLDDVSLGDISVQALGHATITVGTAMCKKHPHLFVKYVTIHCTKLQIFSINHCCTRTLGFHSTLSVHFVFIQVTLCHYAHSVCGTNTIPLLLATLGTHLNVTHSRQEQAVATLLERFELSK